MRNRTRSPLLSLLFPAAVSLALAVGGQGCATLVPGPAGDAGISYTSQGAQGNVTAAPDKVAEMSSDVLASMGIKPSGSSQEDGARVVTGTGRVEHITVRIEASGSGSRVEVIDSGLNNNWNQDFAALILLQLKNAV